MMTMKASERFESLSGSNVYLSYSDGFDRYDCDFDVFYELLSDGMDVVLAVFISSLDDKQRDDVLRAISIAKHCAEKDDDDNA